MSEAKKKELLDEKYRSPKTLYGPWYVFYKRYTENGASYGIITQSVFKKMENIWSMEIIGKPFKTIEDLKIEADKRTQKAYMQEAKDIWAYMQATKSEMVVR